MNFAAVPVREAMSVSLVRSTRQHPHCRGRDFPRDPAVTIEVIVPMSGTQVSSFSAIDLRLGSP